MKVIKILSYILSCILIVILKFYQWFISPLLGRNCRYYPTCSQYAVQAIRIHGPLYGSLLSVRRVVRCNPWHEGGLDPVPCSHNSSPSSIHS